MTKEEKIIFVKKFSRLNLSNVCMRAGVARQTIYHGDISESSLNEVVKIIIKDIKDLEYDKVESTL